MAEPWALHVKRGGFTDETHMWVSLYKGRELSVRDLAEMFHVGTTTIVRRLEMHHVERRSRGGVNGPAHQQFKLWHLDQRYLLGHLEGEVAHLIGCHLDTVYKFKRKLYGGRRYEVRSSVPDRGPEKVQRPE